MNFYKRLAVINSHWSFMVIHKRLTRFMNSEPADPSSRPDMLIMLAFRIASARSKVIESVAKNLKTFRTSFDFDNIDI